MSPFVQEQAAFSKTILICFTSLMLLLVTSSCNHDEGGESSSDGEFPPFEIELLAKAHPDECFCGIGAEDNGPISNSVTGDCSDLTPESPMTECVPKTNQSYIWALTKAGNEVWFGTLANSTCVLASSIAGSAISDLLSIGIQSPDLQEILACEFQESKVASAKPDPTLGDHRTPQIKVYDTGARTLQDISADNCEDGQELLNATFGLRQAGNVDNGGLWIVILAGPSLSGGLNMFAFDRQTKQCLAAENFPEYNDARKMLLVNGVLYSTVGKSRDNENPEGGGRVLRYRGDLSDPLKWEEVGKLDTIGAVMTLHEGRIFVGTWTNRDPLSTGAGAVEIPDINSAPLPGIFISPPVPQEGLTSANFNDWVKIWQSSDYEPDAVSAFAYSLGDLASFEDRLWWGTLHLPSIGFLLHSVLFELDLLSPSCTSDPECLNRQNEAFENSFRATALFRARNFDSTPEIELLYGESSLPVYNSSLSQWEEKPNNASLVPLFGKSGIDNPLNSYTWAMAIYKNRLYLGTFDSSILLTSDPDNPYGADIYRFSDLSSGAEPLSLDGLGNSLNYGIRNMISDEDGQDGDDGLYIGTANPFNIASGGGWELLKLE